MRQLWPQESTDFYAITQLVWKSHNGAFISWFSVFLSLNLKVSHERDNGSQKSLKLEPVRLPGSPTFSPQVLSTEFVTLLSDSYSPSIQQLPFIEALPFIHHRAGVEGCEDIEAMVPAPGNSQFSNKYVKQPWSDARWHDGRIQGGDYFIFPENVISHPPPVRDSHPWPKGRVGILGWLLIEPHPSDGVVMELPWLEL